MGVIPLHKLLNRQGSNIEGLTGSWRPEASHCPISRS